MGGCHLEGTIAYWHEPGVWEGVRELTGNFTIGRSFPTGGHNMSSPLLDEAFAGRFQLRQVQVVEGAHLLFDDDIVWLVADGAAKRHLVAPLLVAATDLDDVGRAEAEARLFSEPPERGRYQTPLPANIIVQERWDDSAAELGPQEDRFHRGLSGGLVWLFDPAWQHVTLPGGWRLHVSAAEWVFIEDLNAPPDNEAAARAYGQSAFAVAGLHPPMFQDLRVFAYTVCP